MVKKNPATVARVKPERDPRRIKGRKRRTSLTMKPPPQILKLNQ